jgi:hypothetical protein
MTNIKLTAIPNKKNPKNKYFIVLDIMHGDADFDEKVEYPCKSKEIFIDKMKLLEKRPLDTGAGGNQTVWADFCENNFSDYIPHDKTVDCQWHAAISDFCGLYYDENGVRWLAKLVD